MDVDTQGCQQHRSARYNRNHDPIQESTEDFPQETWPEIPDLMKQLCVLWLQLSRFSAHPPGMLSLASVSHDRL